MAESTYAHETVSQIITNLTSVSAKTVCCWDPWHKTSWTWQWRADCGTEPGGNGQHGLDPWLYWLRSEDLKLPTLCGSTTYHTYYIGKAETLSRLHNKMKDDFKAAHVSVSTANAPCDTVDIYPSLAYYTRYRTELCMVPLQLTTGAKTALAAGNKAVAKNELEIAEKVLFAACVLTYGLKPAGNAMGTLGPVRAVLAHSNMHSHILKLAGQLSL